MPSVVLNANPVEVLMTARLVERNFQLERSPFHARTPACNQHSTPNQSINQSAISRLMTNSHRPPSNTRRSCLCRIRRCKLSRSASSGRTAPPDTLTLNGHRTHLSGGRADSIHTATTDKTKQFCLCRVWRGDVNQL